MDCNTAFYLLPFLYLIIEIRKHHEKENFLVNRMIPVTRKSTDFMHVKTLLFTHYQNQCNSYGHSEGFLINVRYPAVCDL